MATTLTTNNEILYASLPIEKMETNDDGDIVVYGKCSDGEVDFDNQVVNPAWMAEASKRWLATGANLRVQHNAQRDPAGLGLEVNTDNTGSTWLKALVVEPVAQKLVSKGVLRAFSVGIARPQIERDISGKALGGIIQSGELVEISLVDRPANSRCRFQLAKSVDDGTPEYTGKMLGSDDDIQKMLHSVTDEISPTSNGRSDVSNFDPNVINFTPNDLMKLMQQKIVQQHYDELAVKAITEAEREVYKRDIDTATRRTLASHGHALPDGSYPIANTEDLHNAAILARSGHGNVSGARALIARRAKELGVGNPLTSDKDITPEDVTVVKNDEIKEAVPDVIKDPDEVDGEDGHGGGSDPTPGDNVPPKPQKGGPSGKAAMPKPKKGKKLPPWLNKPSSGDGDDSDDTCKVDHVHTEKCHTDPKTASGAEEPADMSPAPVGELLEYPAKPHMKDITAAAMMRFKTIGIDTDLGMLHDMTCPAFHPEEVAKYFPFGDFSTLIDEELWQRKALAAATGRSLTEATEAQQAWQAAVTLKYADQGMLNDFRVEAYKAFRDANPGPTSFPSPGAISAQRFNRPCITAGHSNNSPGYSSPNSSPRVASSAPNAHHFDRPPLGSGHQSPSPSHMKADFPYPAEQGVPTRLHYDQIEKEKARRALSMLHDHLLHMFPSTCPMLDQDAYRVEQDHPIPQPAGKAVAVEENAEVLGDVYKYIQKLEKQVRAGLITEEEARNKLSKRTAKKYAESLSRQVQKGITSIDEVRKALGLPGEQPQKDPEPVAKVENTEKALTPDVMKTMMSEILEPFKQEIEAQNAKIETLINENSNYKQKAEAQEAELAKHQQRWDALANQRDPSTAAFSGLALSSVAKNGPAGIVKQAEMSERVQGMMMRQLERTWRTSDNPAEREAAYAALCKYKGMTD